MDINNESIFWIGNWWIAFLVTGALFIVFSLPVLMYPKQLPFTDELRHGREKEMQNQRDALAIRGDANFGKRYDLNSIIFSCNDSDIQRHCQ